VLQDAPHFLLHITHVGRLRDKLHTVAVAIDFVNGLLDVEKTTTGNSFSFPSFLITKSVLAVVQKIVENHHGFFVTMAYQ
jgi:hypothetical protein